jgi:WD40 repeat protein
MPTLSPTLPSIPARPAISPENAAHLKLVGEWGKGAVWQVEWIPSSQTLAVATPLGVYMYDAQTLAQTGFIAIETKGDVDPAIETGMMAFSRDGQRLAFRRPFPYNEVQIWQVSTGQLVRSIPSDEPSSPYGLAFAPSGHLALATSEGVWLMDVSTGKRLRTFQAKDAIKAVFSPDGSKLAALSWTHIVRLWDAASGRLLAQWEPEMRSLDCIAFSADGRLLAAGGSIGVRLWDTASGQPIDYSVPPTISQDRIMAVAFSPTENLLAVGGNYALLYLVNAETHQIVHHFQGEDVHEIVSLSFSPDGRQLLSGSADGLVQIWDTRTGQMLGSIAGHAAAASRLAFGLQGKVIVSLNADFIRFWNAKDGRPLRVLVPDVEASDFVMSPDGHTLISHHAWETRFWDMATGQVQRTILKIFGAGMALSSDGRVFAFDDAVKTVELWSVDTGELLHALKGHTRSIYGLAFSPDGQLLASGGRDNTARLWKVSTGELLYTFDEKEKNSIDSVVFAPHGNLLIAGSVDGTVYMWDVKSKQLLNRLKTDSPIKDMTFSPDGRILATNAGLVDVNTGRWLRQFDVKGDSVAFSPDGRLVVVGGRDGVIRLWGVPE